jgi:hypothetical protein
MANKKITELPDIGTPASGDLLEIVDISEGVSKRVAVSALGGGSTPTLQEVLDNNHDLADGNFFAGTGAGDGNTGIGVIGIGSGSAGGNQGDYVVALSDAAANGNIGTSVNAFGLISAQGNEGNSVNALGAMSAFYNLGSHVNALGENSCNGNSGNNVNALGNSPGLENTFNNVNLFGENAQADENGQTVLSKDGTIMARISTADLTETRKYTLQDDDGTLAFLSDIPTNTSDLINDGQNGTSPYVTADQLPSNLNLYATNASSDIATYFKLVTSIDDPDYNDTAVNIPTGAITTTGQFIAALATTANVLVGNPGIINLLTIGNVRRTSGSGTAEFYYEVYHRNSGGTETLIATSSKTPPVSTNVYTEFVAAALLNNGTFLANDRIVVKYYADRIAGGSNPNYDFQFGGTSPVRTNFPIPASNIPLDATPTDGSTNGVQSNGVFDALAFKQDKVSGVSDTEIGYLDGVTSSIQTQLNSKSKIQPNNANHSIVTGVTIETIMRSIEIPANTHSANAFFRVNSPIIKNNVSLNIVYRMYHGLSLNALTTQVGTFTATSSTIRGIPFWRRFSLSGGTAFNTVTGSASVLNDAVVFVGIPQTFTYDPTVSNFFTITVTNLAVGDESNLLFLAIDQSNN